MEIFIEGLLNCIGSWSMNIFNFNTIFICQYFVGCMVRWLNVKRSLHDRLLGSIPRLGVYNSLYSMLVLGRQNKELLKLSVLCFNVQCSFSMCSHTPMWLHRDVKESLDFECVFFVVLNCVSENIQSLIRKMK